MKRKEELVSIMQEHGAELIGMGVKSIGVFGSIARGDDSQDSDYDILVEFNEAFHTFKNFNLLCDFIEEYIGHNYDLVTRQGLSPYIGETILNEVEYVQLAS